VQIDHLAAELRQLLDDFNNTPASAIYTQHRSRLLALVERVETLGNQPVELEAIAAGLDSEQEIRARALEAAAHLLAQLLGNMSMTGAEMNLGGIMDMWLQLAEQGAGCIRGGSQPVATQG
jgi:hypothetical protein